MQNLGCLPRKGLGSACTVFDECTSAICGGRCCSSACTCPQPSADNLLKNAGFDSNLSGWEMFVGTTTGVQWTSDDADGCPFSGSAKINASLGNPAQCVTVAPGTYNVGGWFKNADGNNYFCAFVLYPNPNCTDTAATTSVSRIDGNETKWTFRNGDLVVPEVNMSVMFRCDANPNTYIDKLFVSKAGF